MVATPVWRPWWRRHVLNQEFQRNCYFCILSCVTADCHNIESVCQVLFKKHNLANSGVIMTVMNFQVVCCPHLAVSWKPDLACFKARGWHSLWLWMDRSPAIIMSKKIIVEIGVCWWCQAFQLRHIHLRFGSHSQNPTHKWALRKITFVSGNNLITVIIWIKSDISVYFYISRYIWLPWSWRECKTIIFSTGVSCKAQ